VGAAGAVVGAVVGVGAVGAVGGAVESGGFCRGRYTVVDVSYFTSGVLILVVSER
jgi:hypothetical protein